MAFNPEFGKNFSIESVTEDRVEGFSAFMQERIRSLPYFSDERREELSQESTPDFYRIALDQPLEQGGEWTLLEARVGEETIGGLEGRVVFKGDAGFVQMVFGDPTGKQKGVGSELYTHYENKLLEQGVPNMLAFVHEDNERSQRFHVKRGFDQLHRRNASGSWIYKKLQ